MLFFFLPNVRPIDRGISPEICQSQNEMWMQFQMCGVGLETEKSSCRSRLCLSGCRLSVPGVLWEKKVTTRELSSTAEWRLKGQMLWPEVQSRTSTDGHHMLWQVPTNPAHPQHATNTWTNLTTFPSATTKALGPEADWHLSVAWPLSLIPFQ